MHFSYLQEIDFEALNQQIAKYLDILLLKQMKKNKHYIITLFRKTQTKYSSRIMVQFEESDTEYAVYLLSRSYKSFEKDPTLFDRMVKLVDKKKLYSICREHKFYANVESTII